MMSIEKETELSNFGKPRKPYRDDEKCNNDIIPSLLHSRISRGQEWRRCGGRGRVIFLCLLLFALSVVGLYSRGGATGGAGDWPLELSEDEWDLDTSRKLAILKGEFQPGVTYVQKGEVSTTSLASIGGEKIGEEMTMETESETTFKKVFGGGQKIEIAYTRLAMKGSITSIGETLEFDSDHAEDNPVFKEMFDGLDNLLDNKLTIYVDQDGNIVEDDGYEKPKAVMGGQINGMGSSDLQSAKQIQQMRSLADSLPDDAVKPGDHWEFKVDLDQNTFVGTSNFLGYMNYGGFDVAVVEMEGSIDMESILKQTVSAMTEGLNDNEMNNFVEHMTVKDGRMKSIMFWDNKEKFSRWTRMNLSVTVEAPLYGMKMTIPIEEDIKMNTRIKK